MQRRLPDGFSTVRRLSPAKTRVIAALLLLMAAAMPAGAAATVSVLDAPATPVKLEQVKLLNTEASPMVVLYAAVNQTDTTIDQFTVTVLVFDKDKRLKSRQVAPGRRTLNGKETKFSAMVLDVGAIDATDTLLVGVDQSQAAGSDDWWRADLRTLAEGLMKPAAAPSAEPAGRRR